MSVGHDLKHMLDSKRFFPIYEKSLDVFNLLETLMIRLDFRRSLGSDFPLRGGRVNTGSFSRTAAGNRA